MQKRWSISGRAKITLTNINQHPGVRYRELLHSDCREIVHNIDRARSTASVHLQFLERAGIISVLRVNKNNQFYRLKNKSRIARTVKKYKITA
jgi:DNA-binding transcriptional ArsR family regulator